jgi:hypothetical protein
MDSPERRDSHQCHRITGVAEYPFHNHECSVEGNTDSERSSKISRHVNVTTRPVGMIMIVRPRLVVMVAVVIIRRDGEILLKSKVSDGTNSRHMVTLRTDRHVAR